MYFGAFCALVFQVLPYNTCMKTSTNADLRAVLGQNSWRITSSEVEAFVTELGGHVGPVVFDRHDQKIQPYSVAPWAKEKTDPTLPPILKALRGDFFCLPFGGNGTAFGREKHPVHGETANALWHFESLDSKAGRTRLHLSLKTEVRRGQVDKEIILKDGHNAVYSRHTVSGMTGPINPGHHAMLKFPDESGSGSVSLSRFVYAQVLPGAFETPENQGYSCLQPGAEFSSLDRVSTRTGELADLTHYPARRGYEDLVMMVSDASLPFAWTAVTFPKQRYAWFALKDPRVLRSTIFWMSNGGRYYAPWNGRHLNVMGLEEVTSYFHHGLAESANFNPIAAKGLPTHLVLQPKQPLTVNYIMGVAALPPNFDRVAAIEETPEGVCLNAVSGRKCEVPLDLAFLKQAS